MPITDATVKFLPAPGTCSHCGHTPLSHSASVSGEGKLWVVYCPACERIEEHARIPACFLRGLPAGRDRAQPH